MGVLTYPGGRVYFGAKRIRSGDVLGAVDGLSTWLKANERERERARAVAAFEATGEPVPAELFEHSHELRTARWLARILVGEGLMNA